MRGKWTKDGSRRLNAAVSALVALVLVVGLSPIGQVAATPSQRAGSLTNAATAQEQVAVATDAVDATGTGDATGAGNASSSDATDAADAIAATDWAEGGSALEAAAGVGGDLQAPDADDSEAPRLIARVKALTMNALAVSADDFIDRPVPYLDLDDVSYVHSDTRRVRADSAAWGLPGTATWYAPEGNVTISNRITVAGDVTLILPDGVTVEAVAGITVPETASLTVYGQSGQTGKLKAGVGDKAHAAIGGVGTETVGSITFNGGAVDASNVGSDTNWGGAAIGAAMTGAAGTGGKITAITVNKGQITAEGHRDSVAIGTVSTAPDGEIAVNGGTVVAKGGGFGTGIGGAKNGYVGHIVINGGDVTASSKLQGGYGAVGIGSVAYSSPDHRFGDIVITGGTVRATGASGATQSGAGIGGGKNAAGGTVTITGGEVHASSSGYAGIGGGTGATVNISGGQVTANATVADSGAVTAIGAGHGIQADNINLDWTDETFSTTEITASTYSSVINLVKPYVVKGRNITATQASSAGVTIVPAEAVPDGSVPYLDANGDEQTCKDYTNLGDALAESYTLAAGWYVVDRDLNVPERIICSGDVHLILKDGTKLDAVKGIQVQKYGPTGTIMGTLTIYGQSEKTDQCGTLEVTKPPFGSAGIGSYAPNNGGWIADTSGLITINGGHVKSTGSGNSGSYYGAAAIGGGDCGYGDVVINGGYVEATAPAHAAAIGNGYQGYTSIVGEVKGQVTINGGTVVATASTNGAAIGGGNRGAIRTIRITGGTVTAKTTGNGAAIGSGGANSYDAGGVDAKGESTIEISGGVVTATAVQGAAIGGANSASAADGPGGNIKIIGGTVTATSTKSAGIGGGGTNTEAKLSLGWQDSDASAGKPQITANKFQISDLELIDDDTFAKVDGASYITVSLGVLQAISAESTIVPYAAPYGDVSYLDYNATAGQMEKANRKQGEYTKLSTVSNIATAAVTIGTAGKTTWYAVDADITAAGRITCAGDVRLILENGTTLDAKAGITVKGSNSLTVYGQPADSGKGVGALKAGESGTIATDDAGIGGSGAGDAGTIVINGGDVTARGGTSTAGIGCGKSGASGTVQINGGTVHAYGGGSDDAGSGIGLSHGYKSGCTLGSITVNGGDVHAVGGGNRGSGIGGGYYSNGGSITINGGAVEAQGSGCASGIGGSVGSSHQITITGGTVKAVGGTYGAGIGEGYRPYHSTLTISGGSVYAKGYNGIGGGGQPDPSASSAIGKIVISGGVVTAEATNANGHGMGDKATTSIALLNVSGGQVNAVGGASGNSIRVAATTLGSDDPGTGLPYITAQTYAGSVTLAVPFVMAANGTEVTAADLTAGFAEPTSIYPQGTEVPYLDADGARQVKANGSYTNLSTLTDDPLTLNEGWYVVDADITKASRIVCSGDVHLILKNETKLTASKGISVQVGNSLTVYAQSDDENAMGALAATGAGGYAGIGGDYGADGNTIGTAGTITVNGGDVTATGGSWCAGIGGGNFGDAGAIVVNGGKVTATGNRNGAGIGAASHRTSGEVRITGGTIVAKGGSFAPGIGNGAMQAGEAAKGSGVDVTISGGDVTATGQGGAAGIGGASVGGTTTAGRVVKAGKIVISGGTVAATGSGAGAGIGGGSHQASSAYGSAGDVTISGGDVTATSPSGASIGAAGTGAEGSVTLTSPDVGSGYPRITATRYSGAVTLEVPFVKSTDTSVAVTAADLTAGFAEPTSIYPMATAVPYLDANGARQYCGSYTNLSALSADPLTLTAGWYVVDADVTKASRIVCSGDVHLILKDGTKLDAVKGLQVQGAEGPASLAKGTLSIYGQSEEKGRCGELEVTEPPEGAAGIGSQGTTSLTAGLSGLITINGGHVKATGCEETDNGYGTAAIGGGDGGWGVVVINGGFVEATGPKYGAAIGNGFQGWKDIRGDVKGQVAINGGTVIATASTYGAAIGGGGRGAIASIRITGGTVTADTPGNGAAIGSGGGSSDAGGVGAKGESTIEISGGEVTATAANGAAIGGANSTKAADGPGGNIKITGGTVTATSASSAGIGGGGTNTQATLALKWQDSDAGTGLPRITASSYQISELAEDSDAFVEVSDADRAQVTKQILDGYTSQTTIIPFKTASGEVLYLDYVNGEVVTKSRTAGTYTELTADVLASLNYKLEDGWFVTSAGTLLLDASDGSAGNKELVTSGDVHLILKNDSQLNIRGIVVSEGNSFTAYQQPEAAGEATGILNCLRNTSTGSGDSLMGGAAIGGGRADSDRDAGTLTINGGVINAIGDCSYSITSAQWGAGIGGGNDGKRGTITINGGTVTAKGNIYGAGIGGSVDPRKRPDAAGSGSVTINGGAVAVTGGSFSAGIGGGVYEDGGTIVINGGDVEVRGGEGSNGGAAGIGGGQSASGGTILITGGRVKAAGHVNGAGIGGGGAGIGGGGSSGGDTARGGDGGTITISGTAQVMAEGRQNGAGIGGGGSLKSANGDAGDIRITGGTVTATSSASATFDIGPGTAGAEAAQTTGGTVYLAGEYNDDDALAAPHITASRYGGKVSFGKVFVSSADTTKALTASQLTAGFGAAVTIFPKNVVTPVSYLDYVNGSMEERVCASYYKLSEVTNIGSAAVTIGAAGATTWYAVDKTIAAGERITCAGDVHLILVDGATLSGGGITVRKGNGLTVYAQSTDEGAMGKLVATAASKGFAGIGGEQGAHADRKSGNSTAGDAGAITIVGGNIEATGLWYGAGIGGGHSGDCGSVAIYGGVVTATGSANSYGAGIGGGGHGNGGTVAIYGGTVTATSKGLAAGIGAGGTNKGGIDATARTCSGGSVLIAGGTVTATCEAGNGAGIGAGASNDSSDVVGAGTITITGGTVSAKGAGTGAGIGGAKGNVTGALTLDWSDASDPATGLPRITCSGYRVSTAAYASASRKFAQVSAVATALSTDEVKALSTQSTIVPALPPAKYLDWNASTRSMDEKSCSDYVLLRTYLETAEVKTMGTKKTGTTDMQVDYVELASGWYVVDGALELDERLFVAGDVKLILANGSRLLAKRGVNVDAGKTFTVYQQPEVEGEPVGYLKAGSEGSDGCMYHSAGIGGYDASGVSSVNGGTVVINGGVIYARGGQHGAGIGGAANRGNSGSVTVNYGDVTAVAWNGGDGIGSAWGGAGSGIVTINGGKVTATGGGYGDGQSGAGISGTIVAIHGGEVTATGSSNGSTGAAGIGGRVATGSSVVIDGGKVVAKGGTNAAGIGAGSGGSASTVSLGWTHETYVSTEVNASSYKGSVGFDRPYVLQSDDSTLAKWKSASDNNIDGVTIVPRVDLMPEVVVKEGRFYTAFDGGGERVSMPANSAWTARLDMSTPAQVADEFEFAVRDLAASFGQALPAGTVLTLTAIDKDGRHAHYYAVLERASATVSFTSFASMGSRGALFAPSADDRAYLLSADFVNAEGAAATTKDVGMAFTVSYYDQLAGRERVSAPVDTCSFGLVALGELSATANAVKIARQPQGSALASGKEVYLVGKVTGPGAGGVPFLQNTAATCDGKAGTWVSDNVVAFDLGAYGELGALVGKSCAFSLDLAGLASGSYKVAWTLCVGDGVQNVREHVASNEATATLTPGELPRLTAGPQTAGDRLYAGGESLSFKVTSNRPYRVAIERQTALHDFEQVSITDQRPAASAPATETVTIPTQKGTYRVAFTMTDATTNDDAFYGFVVE